jgi:exosortase/archaeosortase family protein
MAQPIDTAAPPAAIPEVSSWRLAIRRGEFFAGLFLLACANGLAARAVGAVGRVGWDQAFAESFDVSAIALIACGAGIWLAFRSGDQALKRHDPAVGALAFLLIALPIGGPSWVALTGIAFYLLATGAATRLRQAAIILAAVTVPMLWSSLFFQFLANRILEVDAALVAWILGTPRSGNLVGFVSGEGELAIYPACSSLANMSLAFLTWIVISELVEHRRSLKDLRWCALACLSVIVINVGRMSLMGISFRYYDAIHNDLGDAVTSLAILTAAVGWSLWGVRDALSRPA